MTSPACWSATDGRRISGSPTPSNQTCAAHLLRRTGELIADSVAGQARVPRAARRILKHALAFRDQRDEDVIDADEFGLKVTEINERTDKLLAMRPTHKPNRRLIQHLTNGREHMSRSWPSPACRPRTGGPSRRYAQRS
jgi:hypothetical protein